MAGSWKGREKGGRERRVAAVEVWKSHSEAEEEEEEDIVVAVTVVERAGQGDGGRNLSFGRYLNGGDWFRVVGFPPDLNVMVVMVVGRSIDLGEVVEAVRFAGRGREERRGEEEEKRRRIEGDDYYRFVVCHW